ncbi:MAG: hypothetical protein LBI18_10500 [Planctomycetaceae bacterium]|nr:hypothetical protein [Planctomycetaceae bacterium]
MSFCIFRVQIKTPSIIPLALTDSQNSPLTINVVFWQLLASISAISIVYRQTRFE